MDRSKLIVRTMRKQYPLVIGRKERYASGDNTLFREWARNSKGQFSTPEDEDRDAAVAAKAEAFLRANPFAVLFAAQLDQGKPWWKAWRGPYLVASDLGWRTMTAAQVLALKKSQIAASLRRCRLGCRNLGHAKAAENVHALAKAVADCFSGRAERIWTTPTSFKELKDNMYSIRGIGSGIGNMMIKIFVEYGMVPQIPKTKEALATLQLKPDTHVIHVFFRAGLIRDRTERAALQAAATLAADLPAALDTAGWDIGVRYCHKDREPECDECPIGFKTNGERLCPRRPARH